MLLKIPPDPLYLWMGIKEQKSALLGVRQE